ncbi:MAG TPA: alpha/beta fold hydrolase, partial [Candidatus Kapabacteria bacterium]|nr:alpha/beta fold hydrolase [Candidatus Kapabacteria bacterium]
TAKIFNEAGYNIFLFDSRAAGESEGEFCTHGYYEKYDLQAVIDALCEREEVDSAHIGLLGISMGGSIALQTAPIEPRIRCIIAESVYTSLNEVTGDYLKHFIGFNSKILHDTAIQVAEKEAHFQIEDIAPIEALKHINIPVLFIHGSNDELVKAKYSELLCGAYNGTRELYIVKGAGHNDLRKVGGDEYNRRRLDFFERYL